MYVRARDIPLLDFFLGLTAAIPTKAETNGGGLALWGGDGSMGTLRTSDATYYRSWLPWVSAVGQIIAKNQITNGGVS